MNRRDVGIGLCALLALPGATRLAGFVTSACDGTRGGVPPRLECIDAASDLYARTTWAPVVTALVLTAALALWRDRWADASVVSLLGALGLAATFYDFAPLLLLGWAPTIAFGVWSLVRAPLVTMWGATWWAAASVVAFLGPPIVLLLCLYAAAGPVAAGLVHLTKRSGLPARLTGR